MRRHRDTSSVVPYECMDTLTPSLTVSLTVSLTHCYIHPSTACSEVRSGIHDFFYGCQGLEKLAFPIMRKQLGFIYQLSPPAVTATGVSTARADRDHNRNYFQQQQNQPPPHTQHTAIGTPQRLQIYQQTLLKRAAVERFSLPAPSDCFTDCTDTASPTIDAILVHGREDAAIDAFTVHESKSPGQVLPIVLYCPPNAGFYECIGMAPVQSNWVGVYTQLVGLDVCVFNYR